MCQCKSQEHCGQCNTDPKRQPHKHAALIKAWADGASIEEFHANHNYWVPIGGVGAPIIWSNKAQYRIKPEPKPDIVKYIRTSLITEHTYHLCVPTDINKADIKVIFDGETGKLKSVELIK